MEGLISVIIPVYKVESYLDECVKSVVSQTYPNLEIILVDDGSPDNCPQMCDAWAKKDERIRVIHKKNGGLSSARNAGMKVATGDYIGFVDSDDFISPEMFELLQKGFTLEENIGVTTCMIMSWLNGHVSDFQSKWVLRKQRTISYNEYVIAMILERSSFTVTNKLYRADLLASLSFQEGRNNEDLLFMYYFSKILQKYKVNVLELPYPLYYYRRRADSICTTAKKPLAIDVIANYQQMMSDCQQESQHQLYEIIKYKYTQKVISFIDELFITPSWYKSYYIKYKPLLNNISFYYVYKHFRIKMVLIFFLQKYLPSLRKLHPMKK